MLLLFELYFLHWPRIILLTSLFITQENAYKEKNNLEAVVDGHLAVIKVLFRTVYIFSMTLRKENSYVSLSALCSLSLCLCLSVSLSVSLSLVS